MKDVRQFHFLIIFYTPSSHVGLGTAAKTSVSLLLALGPKATLPYASSVTGKLFFIQETFH
jgi:hypothetical protein